MLSVDVVMIVCSARQCPALGCAQTLNDVPHPQVLFACGLLMTNPLLSRLVS